MLDQGDTVDDFGLEGTLGDGVEEFTLSSLADGRPTVLAFYVYDFSPVCTDQMCEINDVELLTLNDDAAAVGISPDGPYSHQRFLTENDLSYPLLSDPGLDVYERFGLVSEVDGRREPRRGIVLLDADRTVRYRWAAESNWDDWDMKPLTELNRIVNDLVA